MTLHTSVNDVIDDKNVVTKIMSKSTGLQHILFNVSSKLLIKLEHPMPSKPQLPPHRCKEVKYGSKTHLPLKEDTSIVSTRNR